MEPKHQNLREIFMHPKYKSNSNTRSQHVYFSFIFSQAFPGGKCSPKIGSKPQKKKKGMDPTNKRVKGISRMMVKEDPRTTAVQEAQRSTSPDGTRGGPAPGELLQGQEETDGYLGCLH